MPALAASIRILNSLVEGRGYVTLFFGAVRSRQLPGPRAGLVVETQEGEVLNIVRLVQAFMINDQSRLCDEYKVA